MNRTRRRLLAGAGSVGLASLAGCTGLDFIRGEESLSFAASAAVVAESNLDATGYTESRRESDTIVQPFDVAGVRREVEVTNQIAEYDRGITLLGTRLRGALFVALSTPKVRVLGRTFNPVGEMSTDELVATIQNRYDQIGAVTRERSRTVSMLNESVEIVRYRAEGRFVDANLSVDLTLHVSNAVAVGDDFVVCLGIHPRILDDTTAVNQLLRGVEHSD